MFPIGLSSGLTAREYFAAAALPGIIIAYRRYAEKLAARPGNGSVNDIYAQIAYATADAMFNPNNAKSYGRSY